MSERIKRLAFTLFRKLTPDEFAELLDIDGDYTTSETLYKELLDVRSRAQNPCTCAEQTRCDRCGWPLAKTADEGCVPGNCGQRPLPELRTHCAECGGKIVREPAPIVVAFSP